VAGSESKKDRLPSAIVASTIAVTLAQPLGRLIQRYLTTSSDLTDTEIVAVESQPQRPLPQSPHQTPDRLMSVHRASL
jgi:hypothetical protein